MMRRSIKFGLLFLLLGAIINVAVAWACAWPDLWPEGQTMQYVRSRGFSRSASTSDLLVTAHYQQRRGGVRAVINTWQPDGPLLRRPKIFQQSGKPLLWIDPDRPSLFKNVSWNAVRCVDGYGFPALSMSCAWRHDETPVDAILLPPKKVTPPPAAPGALPPNAFPFLGDASRVGNVVVDDQRMSTGSFPAVAFAFAPPAPTPQPRALPLRPIPVGFAINTGANALALAALWGLLLLIFQMRGIWRGRRNLCPACAYPVGTSEVCTECGKPVARRMTA